MASLAILSLEEESLLSSKKRKLFWIVLVGTTFPSLFASVGFFSLDFPLELQKLKELSTNTEPFFQQLRGPFLYTILEWICIATAFFTVCLTLTHFIFIQDYTSLLIGSFLIVAGGMDVFHILIANRFLSATSNNEYFIPFSWTMAQICKVCLLLSMTLFLLWFPQQKKRKSFFGLVFLNSFFLGFAYFVISLNSAEMFFIQMLSFESIWGVGSWDLIAILLFLLAGGVVLPRFYQKYPNHFVWCLWLSIVPQLASQFHMNYSKVLFDTHFNLAYILKVFAYLTLFSGIFLDYLQMYSQSEKQKKKLKQEIREKEVSTLALELEQKRFQLLYKIITQPTNDLDKLMNDALQLTTELLELDVGVISHIEGDYYEIKYFYPEESGLQKGQVYEIGETYCSLTFSQDSVLAIDYMEKTEHKRHPCYQRLKLESYIGTTIQVEGKRYGTLNFSSRLPRVPEFSLSDKNFIKLLAHWVGSAMERKQIENEREAAKKTKDEFLANMSHEIRTPLNAILGYSECLFSGLNGELNPSQQESLGKVIRAGNNLLEIINDILDLSKLESGHMRLQLERVDLIQIILHCIELLEPLARQKNLPILFSPLYSTSWIIADEVKIRQCISNLLSNAIKFTEVGSVSIEIQEKPQEVMICVSDTGIGINAEDQKRIFSMFTQVDGSMTKKYKGTGLGLTIAKNFAEMHKGTLIVKSRPEIGSSFILSLPRK